MNKLEYLKKREIKLLTQRDIIYCKSQHLNTTSTGLGKNILLFFVFIHVSICIDLKESLNFIALVMEAIMNVTVSCFRM